MDKIQYKKIIFFETSSEIDEYIANKIEVDLVKELFVAMTPEAYSYLKEKKWQVEKNTLPYFTNKSHEKILEKSKVLVDWLRKESNFTNKSVGVYHAYNESLTYFLRFAIHYYLWAIEIVLNAVEMHQPLSISASFSNKKPSSSILVEYGERYLGSLVRYIAEKRGLKFNDISIEKKRNGKVFFSQVAINIKYLFLFILRRTKFFFWKISFYIKRIFDRRKIVFFTTNSFQMNKLIEKIKGQRIEERFSLLQGPFIFAYKIANFVIKLLWPRYSKTIIAQKELLEALEVEIKKRNDLFSYREISFTDEILQKFRENISPYILGLMLWSLDLNKFINVSNGSAFICIGNRGDDKVLAELCRQKNIPTIFISHGSHVRPNNKYETIEWGELGRGLLHAPFSYLALQSPFIEDYLKVFPSKSEKVITGPLIWGKPIDMESSESVFKEKFNGKYKFKDVKVVMHAGTPKRASRFYVYETPDEYIQALIDLANAVEKIPNVILLIRFRPSATISIKILKKLVPFSEKVILSVAGSFLDVLGMADLLVSFSSTTITEALQNKIPVLLYGGRGRYQHIVASEITQDTKVKPSAVYAVKKASDLEYGITNIFKVLEKKQKDSLFDSYIYPQDVRTELSELLNKCCV